MSVSSFMGSKCNDDIGHANLKYKFGNRNFWVAGYYVSALGLNRATIQKYIREQDQIEYKRNTKQ